MGILTEIQINFIIYWSHEIRHIISFSVCMNIILLAISYINNPFYQRFPKGSASSAFIKNALEKLMLYFKYDNK